ncbi:hypothetical protein CRG98_008663 [Punica granatum]|uniref:Uncharacterized protein n=1 Tax=Punica granatum TaxID=22663 RepID=A0A2I0KRJ3_PUNGR|nr:hypothetical protein CRG98_008663 [Punica granatum]
MDFDTSFLCGINILNNLKPRSRKPRPHRRVRRPPHQPRLLIVCCHTHHHPALASHSLRLCTITHRHCYTRRPLRPPPRSGPANAGPVPVIHWLHYISVYIQKHKPLMKQALANLEAESPRVAALFVDMFCTPLADVADELSIPCYLFFASPASFLGFMVHLSESEGQTGSESGQLAYDTELLIPGFVNKEPKGVLSLAVLTGRDGHTWLIHHARRYRELEGIVINTFQELEHFALSSLSRSLSLPPPSRVVFLCFGSMGSLNALLVREIVAGLEQSGQRFLWSLREPPKGKIDLPTDYWNFNDVLSKDFLEQTAEISLVCGWVPQNSILESLWHRVPFATWPVYAEQQMNAFEMVRGLRLAVEIRLDYREGSDLVRAEEVERGVRALMEGDGDVRRKFNLHGNNVLIGFLHYYVI